MPRDFQFASPDLMILLPVVLLLGILLFLAMRWRDRCMRALAKTEILDRIAILRSPRLEKGFAGLVSMAWIAGCLALMYPQGNAHYKEDSGGAKSQEVLEESLTEGDDLVDSGLKRKAHEIIFLVDASASMAVRDTRQGTSRLDLAKEVIEELTGRMDGQSVAVYAFTSQVSTVSPPTMDYLYVRLMARRIGINEGDVAGTDFLEALEFIRQRHLSKGSLKTLVILSDGGDTRLERLDGEARERELEAIVGRLGDSTSEQLRVFTVGLGTEAGAVIPDVMFEGQAVKSTLDEEFLKGLASRGRYYLANDYSVLSIAEDILDIMGQDDPYVREEEILATAVELERTVARDHQRELMYDDYYQIPALIALIAVFVAWRMPRSRRLG